MNIGIAGGGVLGRLLAYKLINSGHAVTLYDQDDESGKKSCSMAAVGMLAPVAELEKSDQLIYQLGMEALNIHWPEIIKQFNDKVYFRQMGSLMVSHPKDQAELTNFISLIDSKQKTSYQKLNQHELISLEPALSKFQQAYFLPDEGQLDSQALMDVLHEYLKSNLQWKANTKVISIINHKINDEQFDLAFDCRGLGAVSAFQDLQAVRGEIIWLHAPDVNITRPVRFMHPRYGLYIAPRPDNVYLIGASEIYAEDYSPISVRSSLELLTAAYYLHPGFAEARIIKTVTHCRPVLFDHLPKISCTKDYLAINGLYRHGYLIAPALIADLMRYIEYGKSQLQFSTLWRFV